MKKESEEHLSTQTRLHANGKQKIITKKNTERILIGSISILKWRLTAHSGKVSNWREVTKVDIQHRKVDYVFWYKLNSTYGYERLPLRPCSFIRLVYDSIRISSGLNLITQMHKVVLELFVLVAYHSHQYTFNQPKRADSKINCWIFGQRIKRGKEENSIESSDLCSFVH